jgi:hypothetical protein
MTSRVLTSNDVLELKLENRLTDSEAQQIRHFLATHVEPESERLYFDDENSLRTIVQVLRMAVDRGTPTKLLADAIDKKVGKKTIADDIRAHISSKTVLFASMLLISCHRVNICATNICNYTSDY